MNNHRAFLRPIRSICFLAALGLSLIPQFAIAEANYVYHERTSNDVTGGDPSSCGSQTYVPALTPNSAQPYVFRFKVEYQNYTDTLRVYYTTDGSTPSGALGVSSGTTTTINGSYQCTFTNAGNVIDLCSATIPAQPAGTVVKYIVSARHSGGGAEIFANGPGSPCGCGTPTSSSALATVFTYTVSSTPEPIALVESRTSGGATTANPPYLETGTWVNSVSKSTASGGMVGSGSRFATNGTPSFTVTPTLTAGVTYLVQSTLTATTASPDLVATVATSGTSASTLPATTTAFQGGKGNLWTILGTITPSITTPSITFTYSSGILHTTNRFYADAIRFLPVTPTAVKTWSGGSTTNFWTSGLNWGGTAPNPSGGDAIIFAGSTRTNPVMDGPFAASSITYSSGATNFFITGVGGSLTIGAAGVTNNSSSDQFIAAPVAQGATALNFSSGSSTNQLTVNGLLTGSGGYSATGAGTLYISNAANTITGPVSVSGGATLRLPASSSIGGTGAGAGSVTLNGGTLRNDDTTIAGSLLTHNRPIIIGASGGTIRLANSGQILLSSNIITGAGNTLTVTGSGELRVITNASAANPTGGHFTFSKLVIDGSFYTIGQSGAAGADDSLGAVPATTLDDAITLQNGGRLRNNVAPLTLDPKRGITLGTGGGFLRAVNTSCNLTVPSAIKGANPLTIGGGTDIGTITLSSTANSFGNVTILGNPGSKFLLGASGVIPDSSSVSNGANGVVFDLAGNSETIRAFVGSVGTLALGTGGILTVSNTSPESDTFSATTITGTGGLIVKKGTGTWNVTGATGWGNLRVEAGTYGIGGVNGLGSGTLTLQGGKLASTSGASRSPVSTAVNLNGDTSLGDSVNTGNLTFSSTCPWTIQNATRQLTVDTITATIGGAVSDDGTPRGLIKAGSGTLALTSPNTYGGDTTILAGTINIDGDATLGNGTGTLQLSGGTLNTTASRTSSTDPIANPINVVSNSAITTTSTAGTVDLNLTGALGGTDGTLTFSNAAPTAGGEFRPRLTGGTFTMSQPIVIANQPNGTTLLSDFNTSGTTHTFNGVISGDGSYKRTASISGTGGETVFAAANTFTGTTTVIDGTLRVNGSLAAGSAVTVAGGILGGTGTISGPITVQAAGILAPGASIGTLTLGTAPTLAGTTIMEISSPDGADKLNITSGTTAFGGTLTVANIGGTLANGNTFDLFDGALSGSFAALNLPNGSAHWNISDLNVGGTITYVNNNPVGSDFNLGVAVGGSTIANVFGKHAADTDADGDTVTITAVSTPSSGTATIIGGTNIAYTSTGGTGSDSFTYTLSDGLGGTDTKTISVTISSPTGFNRLSGPINNGNGTFTLEYLGIPGLNYTLDESPDLVAPYNWFPVVTNSASGTGAISYTVPLSYPSGSFRTRHVP